MSWTQGRYDTEATTLKDDLDKKWTYNAGVVTAQVMASAVVDDVYYAAVERKSKATGLSNTTAVVVTIEQYAHGAYAYYAMGEAMLSHFVGCPTGILAVLSKAKDENALKWRQAAPAEPDQ